MRVVRFDFGAVELRAELMETPTAEALWRALPFEARAQTWGDEVYFEVPVSLPREPEARALVEAGEIAYWPDGECIAIGFGRTPISGPGEIRLASPCNVWAKARDDVRALKAVKAGARVRVTRAEDGP